MTVWPAGAATGIGSLPGTDPVEAVRLVFGELPDLPHLPELPERGVGADMIGRTAALLVDLPVEIAPSGWRITARGGRDLRRADELLSRDLDALQVQAGDYAGPLKIQLAGPWTLAAGIELVSGHRVLTDQGAVRDLIASLAEGLRVHCAALTARVPSASVVVQLDEPALPAVLAGALPTASGYGTVRSVDEPVVESGLRDVLQVAPEGARVVHCCASDAPIRLIRNTGADAIALDLDTVTPAHYDELAATIDVGGSAWLGAVPATASQGRPDAVRATERVTRLWRDLGFDVERLAASVVLTPSCGMAGADPQHVRAALVAVRTAARQLAGGE